MSLRRVPRLAVAAVLALALAPAAPPAFAADPTADAEKAAQAWLALTDGGKYAASWDAAAAAFKSAVSKEKWEGAMKQVRAPLGALKSRTMKSAKFMTELPGAPAGEYVVIQYETSFESKAGAIETVTPMKEKDGSWHVSGYYIK